MTKLKLFEIKQWFSPQDAAEYLFGAGTSQQTLDELIEDGELTKFFRIREPQVLSERLSQDGLPNFCSVLMDLPPDNYSELKNLSTEQSRRVFFEIGFVLMNGTYELLGFGKSSKHPDQVMAHLVVQGQFKCILTHSFSDLENEIISIPEGLPVIKHDSYEDCLPNYELDIDEVLSWTPIVDKLAISYQSVLPSVGEVGFTRQELDNFVQKHSSQKESSVSSQRKIENNLYRIISVLQQMIIDPNAKSESKKQNTDKGKPPFKNKTQLIEFLSDKSIGYGDNPAFSKNNLFHVFKMSSELIDE